MRSIGDSFDLRITGKDGTFIDRVVQLARKNAAILIIALALLIRVPLLFIPDSYGFQFTSWRQTETASIAQNFTENGYRLFYPQINWRGSGPGYVETEFQLYPFLSALLYTILGEHIWVGLGVSLIFSVGTHLFFYRLAARILSPGAALWALAFFAFSPLFIRYSVVFMPEPTLFFFYVAALYFFQTWLDEQRTSSLLFAAASTALAILVKATSIHIGLIFLILLIAKYRLRVFTMPRLWLFALLSLLPPLLWYLHARNLYLEYGNTFGLLSGGDSKFNNLVYWTSPFFYYSIARIDLILILSVGAVVPFLAGLMVCWRQRRPLIVLAGLATIGLYYMIIPRYTSLADYYHIYAVPFFALSIGLGMVWLFQHIKIKDRASLRSGRALIGYLSLIVFLLFAAQQHLDSLEVEAQPLRECAQHVASLTTDDKLIIISTISPAVERGVANNYEEPDIFFYSHRYGWSLAADQHDPQLVEQYRQDGAEYLIIYAEQLYWDNPALVEYLEANSTQIGPGVEAGCAIFQFSAAT